MPVYEYQCQACRKRFEILRPMSQMDAPIACPECAMPDARRSISLFAALAREPGGGSRLVAGGSSGGCSGCSGGNCGSCGH